MQSLWKQEAAVEEAKNLMGDEPNMVATNLVHMAGGGEIGETKGRVTMIVARGEEDQKAKARNIALLPALDTRELGNCRL